MTDELKLPPSPPPPAYSPDSFTEGLAAAARSRKGRSLIAAAWPYVLAAATAVGGWVAKSQQLEPRLVVIEQRLGPIAADIAAVRKQVTEFTTTEQRKTVRVGRQAAYATAAAEAYETPATRTKKQAWAQKYADAYERMVVHEDVTPDVAYTALFKQVNVP